MMRLFTRGCGLGLGAMVALVFSSLPASGEAPATQPRQYVVQSDGTRPTPIMAVDQVCAWPKLVLLPDGTITASIFNQPNHAEIVGGVDCWASEDDGKTWTKRGNVASPEPNTLTNRMNIAAGLAANGDLVVICGGWHLAPDPKVEGKLKTDRPLRPVVCRSSDGGRNWTVDADGFPAASPEGDILMPHGIVQAGMDGALRMAAYGVRPGDRPRWRYSFIYRSDDDGKTWHSPVPLDAHNRRNENFIFHVGEGKWLAAARHAHLELYSSSDDARTWIQVGPLTEKDAFPGSMIKLKDGRVLLSNGNRTKDDRRVEVRISEDGGGTWSAPKRVLDIPVHDCGYPSSVQLANGLVVTAYYAQKTDYHDAYHMGVVIWDPQATFGTR